MISARQDFTCLLGQLPASRYLAKQSRCYCEGVCYMTWTSDSTDFGQSRWCSITWWGQGHTKLVEDLKREKTEVPKEERFLPGDCLWIQDCNINTSLVSCLPACPADFGLASLHKCEPVLITHLSPVHTHTHTPLIDLFGLCLVTQSYLAVCDPMDCSPPGCSVHGDSPGKNTGVGCHTLLQVIFSTQGSNPGLLHWTQVLYRTSQQALSVLIDWFHPHYCFYRHLSIGRTRLGTVHH